MPWFIYSENSGMALDVADGSSDDGAQIQQYHHHGGANQQWEIIRLWDSEQHPDTLLGPYVFVGVQSSKAFDDWFASMDDFNPIKQYRVHGGDNQQWYIERHVDPTLGSVRFVIVNKLSRKAMDIRGGSMDEHAPLIQYRVHRGPNQQWRIEGVGTNQAFPGGGGQMNW